MALRLRMRMPLGIVAKSLSFEVELLALRERVALKGLSAKRAMLRFAERWVAAWLG